MTRLKQNLYPINLNYVKYSIFYLSDLSKGKREFSFYPINQNYIKYSSFNHSNLIHHDKTERNSLSNKSKLCKVFNF